MSDTQNGTKPHASERASPPDALVEALRRKSNDLEQRVAELENTVADLETCVETLQERVPDPAMIKYNNMSRDDKITVVWSKLKAEADATNGAAKAEYRDVIRMFDGQVSTGHAYGLMEAVGSRDGCRYAVGPDGVKRVTFRVCRAEN
jgi:predicted RNase H-like nuclease (RuvC/YqgF family)